jgi:hypothetical protein
LRFAKRRILQFIHSKNCPQEDSDDHLYKAFQA